MGNRHIARLCRFCAAPMGSCSWRLIGLAASVRIINQYERAVVFRLGPVGDDARGPGLVAVVPFVDRVDRVSPRIVTMPIQSQGVITHDNVSADVSGVVSVA